MTYKVAVATNVLLVRDVDVDAASEEEAKSIVRNRLAIIRHDELTAEQLADPTLDELRNEAIFEAIDELQADPCYISSSGWSLGLPVEIEPLEIIYVAENPTAQAQGVAS
jgi:hypothetical protein